MKRGRALLIGALVAAMLATGVAQSVTSAQRRKMLKAESGASGPSVAGMNSFALALLLGGLRGPLVMILWTQSESQKNTKNLEGVETQIEWIRLLQPEFDTVHLFQIWNKAYNLSAQMASLSNKYLTILDALAYAHSVDRERPDDINIIMAMASIFNDKLGGSHEKQYYKKRIRDDSMVRDEKTSSRMAGVRPTRFESLLEADGTVREKFLLPRFARPTLSGAGVEEFYDGSALQFMKRYEPYPYGVSPQGLAFNYFKRGQLLQDKTGQKHLQISQMVVDSRPSLALKAWSEDEWDVGGRAEARFLDVKAPAERFDVLLATAKAKPVLMGEAGFEARKADLDQAIYQYKLVIQLCLDSAAEFRRHLSNPEYQMHMDMYRSHLEDLVGRRLIVSGDLAYLEAMAAKGAPRKELLSRAAQYYQQAARTFSIVRVRYYIELQILEGLLPAGVTRANLEKLSDGQLQKVMDQSDARTKARGYDTGVDDTTEYNSYVKRCRERLEMISQQH